MSTQVHSVDIDLDGRQWNRITFVSRQERLASLYRRSQHRPISRTELDYVNRELDGWSPGSGDDQEEVVDDTDDDDDEEDDDFRVRTTRSPRNEELEEQLTREAALLEDDGVEYRFESDEDDDSLSEDPDDSDTDSNEDSNDDSEDELWEDETGEFLGMPHIYVYLC